MPYRQDNESRRQQILRECRNKVKYHSSEEAWGVAEGLRLQNPGHEIDSYVCRWCNGWHTGHRPGNGKHEPESPVILHHQAEYPERMNRRLVAKKRARSERRELHRAYARQEEDQES